MTDRLKDLLSTALTSNLTAVSAEWLEGEEEAVDEIIARMPEIVAEIVPPLKWSDWVEGSIYHTWSKISAMRNTQGMHGVYWIGRKYEDKNVGFAVDLSDEWWIEPPRGQLMGPYKTDIAAMVAVKEHNIQLIKEGLNLC